MNLRVYEIHAGSLETFVRFGEPEKDINRIDSLLSAHAELLRYMKKKKSCEIESAPLLEVWQVPIPFSRGLAYATLFRFNPYGGGYLVSPVEMKWLEATKI